MANDGENVENFSWAPKSLWLVTAAMKLKDSCSLEGELANLDSVIKKADHFASKGPSSPRYGVSSSHVHMWELDHKEGWVLKNWFFQTVVLEKTLESPLDRKEIKSVNPKGNQSWIYMHWKDWCKSWRSNPLATWSWEWLKAKGEGSDRGWDGWMASLTQWTWAWANSRR